MATLSSTMPIYGGAGGARSPRVFAGQCICCGNNFVSQSPSGLCQNCLDKAIAFKAPGRVPMDSLPTLPAKAPTPTVAEPPPETTEERNERIMRITREMSGG